MDRHHHRTELGTLERKGLRSHAVPQSCCAGSNKEVCSLKRVAFHMASLANSAASRFSFVIANHTSPSCGQDVLKPRVCLPYVPQYICLLCFASWLAGCGALPAARAGLTPQSRGNIACVVLWQAAIINNTRGKHPQNAPVTACLV